jgi:hypothetical protein
MEILGFFIRFTDNHIALSDKMIWIYSQPLQLERKFKYLAMEYSNDTLQDSKALSIKPCMYWIISYNQQ